VFVDTRLKKCIPLKDTVATINNQSLRSVLISYDYTGLWKIIFMTFNVFLPLLQARVWQSSVA